MRDPLVGESASAHTPHEDVHAGLVGHLAGAVPHVELGQVPAKVLAADMVMRAVAGGPSVDVDRCEEILRLGRERGMGPRPLDTLIAEWVPAMTHARAQHPPTE